MEAARLSLLMALLLWSDCSGYEYFIDKYGYRKFQDVSSKNSFTMQCKSTALFYVGFFNSSIMHFNLYVISNGYNEVGNPTPIEAGTNFSTTEYRSYWFEWGSGVVNIGLGVVVGESTLGFLPMDGNVSYVAFRTIKDGNLSINFPDYTSFTRFSGYRLDVQSLTSSEKSPISCGRACLANTKCYAFNYRRNHGKDNCQTIAKKAVKADDITFAPFNKVADPQWAYYFSQLN